MQPIRNLIPIDKMFSTDNADWTYEKRREIQEILPNLYLGPFITTKNKMLLNQLKITHILLISHSSESSFIFPKHPESFIYANLNVAESLTCNVMSLFPSSAQFITQGIQSGGVLVCSNAGICRSPTFVIAYLIQQYNMTFVDAFVHVQNKRFCINPNEQFKLQLHQYEPLCRARGSIAGFNYGNGEQGTRRGLEEGFVGNAVKRQCCDGDEDQVMG